MSPKVAIVSGGWGQNVGNAFFNLGGRYVLEEVFGEGNVQFIQDQPGYRTLHNKYKGNPVNYLDFVAWLDIEYLVLQGPVLNGWMRANWESTFNKLKNNGVKIILLSCAFFKFTNTEIESVRGFLADYPPALILTRDRRTYEIIKTWLPSVPKYNGIDSGFFINKCFVPFKVNRGPYIVSNFDRYPEPTISTSASNKKNRIYQTIEVLGKIWYLSVPRILSRTSHASKVWSYIGDLIDRRKLPSLIDGYEIVRTEHRYFPHVTYKIYRHSNATASDEPWTYLSIYANASFTLSDRVHACVATLAFGRPAMLFTPSPRVALFDNVGAGSIVSKLTSLNMEVLESRQQEQLSWLRGHI